MAKPKIAATNLDNIRDVSQIKFSSKGTWMTIFYKENLKRML